MIQYSITIFYKIIFLSIGQDESELQKQIEKLLPLIKFVSWQKWR